MLRTLVHLSKDGSCLKAKFVQSVTGHFLDGPEDQVNVSVSLEDKFILTRDDKTGCPLKRPSFCPFKHLSVTEAAALPLAAQQRGVDVGVAVLLQSSNQSVFLTRRAERLRIFPNVWVPPGGHMEPGETLLDAGLRELKEETGLNLEPDDVSTKILGLWESAFPFRLSRGLPQRHHIVVYLLLGSSLSHLQLQASLSPCPAEVSACAWLRPRLVRAIVDTSEEEEEPNGGFSLDDLPTSISALRVSAGGALSSFSLPVATLLNRAPAAGPDLERVSTGTKFCLELWLRSLENSDPSALTSDP